MITKFKLFENHLDLDPYGEEDWNDNRPLIKWLRINYPDQDKWSKIRRISCCYNNNQLNSLEGIENLTNLISLNCSFNQLTNLNGIENLTKLKDLICSENQLTSLDGIENLINLRKLYCSYNQLTSLEGIENLTNLNYLSCRLNNFTDEYKQYLKDYCKKNKIGLAI